MSDRSAAMRELMKRLWSDPAYKERRAEELRQRWQDPAYRARVAKSVSKTKSTPEARQRTRDQASAQFATPEARALQSARIKAFFEANPERLDEWKARLSHSEFFWCPQEHQKLYRKLRIALGAEAAREQIRNMLAKEFAAVARYDEESA